MKNRKAHNKPVQVPARAEPICQDVVKSKINHFIKPVEALAAPDFSVIAEAERDRQRLITMSAPENARIQTAIKQVLSRLAVTITDQSTERTIAGAAARMLAEWVSEHMVL